MSTQYQITKGTVQLWVDERSSRLTLYIDTNDSESDINYLELASDLEAEEMAEIALSILRPCSYNVSDLEKFKENLIKQIRDL